MSTSGRGAPPQAIWNPVIKHGPHKWQTVTPSGEQSPICYTRHQAWDWLLRHSCDTFAPADGDYADVCQHCGGHVTTHEPSS